MNNIDTIIFDLGGVLIDWNPKHLYRKIFRTETAVDYFLENITTGEWNEMQDGGRSLEEATKLLVDQFPHYTPEIEAFYDRWEEDMLGGAIEGTVDILRTCINDKRYRIYALTNWSAETFPVARKKFEFLNWFEGILVSGEEKLKKPDHRIYQRLLDKFNLSAAQLLFIDDNLRNIKSAEEFGIKGIHFQSPEILKSQLIEENILR